MKQPGNVPALKDADAARALLDHRQAIVEIQQRPIVDGVLIKNVTLRGATPVSVRHGLSRVPRGWLVVRYPVAAASGRVGQTASDGQTLSLQADGWGADISVDLWVF